MSNYSHPIGAYYASSRATAREIASMRVLYDKAISDEGITQTDMASLLNWVGAQESIKREEEDES